MMQRRAIRCFYSYASFLWSEVGVVGTEAALCPASQADWLNVMLVLGFDSNSVHRILRLGE